MKLNARVLRYMSNDEFRVLTAVEMGSKNHEVVPTKLIQKIANLKNGGSINKFISELARKNLIAKVQNVKYDGYRLTYGGYDYLALRTFSKRDSVHSVGRQIGVGKESDINVVLNDKQEQMVLKIQRLGRMSFRTIKNNRDYLKNRKSASWMYMSRLAAIKEYAFLCALYEHGFPVPKPIDQNRHCVVMELVDGLPLYQINDLDEPEILYEKLIGLIVRFAENGLIHGDFNEFNIMLTNEDEPIVIDFPQMISMSHENAEFYFDRDVACIVRFFRKRFRFESDKPLPLFSDIQSRENHLDIAVRASGFSKRHQKQFDEMLLEDCDSSSDEEPVSDSSQTDTEEDESIDEHCDLSKLSIEK